MTEDIDKFARKVERVYQAKIVDKQERAKREDGRARKAFYEGQIQALREAIAALKNYADRWAP